ncbi:Glycosyl transferase family 11 [Prochlorococcus marinus str. MIT 9515]|uniref:Glycosyl transferase family 11 n=1 Tax=Prochlorococcus marinus (strain MIT 9515) TaxID=167542 RepID=A2BUY8_PROM5|nr:alpha-1,2-fucosyltransferase [Prochlorococcus marinus]ABM71599.1 Glycosyl transferase family 11 [Prochlorococcus marinus str. MIT 9515]
MIFSRMVGGLGNQLFQTAACLKYRKPREKVIISFLGDIHIPKRINCLNSIFEKPTWLYYDNSKDLNILKKFVAKTSASLRFGSFMPLISVNDRNFNSRDYDFNEKKLLFLDGYFNQKWTYSNLKNYFSQLKLRPIELNNEYLKIRDNDVVIHLRGSDFLKISDLNICKLDYYKKSIKYAISKGHRSFKLISEDQQYGKEFLKEIKKCFIDLKISMLNSDTIKNDFNLIRSSKFAILSNSTFSWWASFLSITKKEFIVPENFSLKEKRVILPNETILNRNT